MIARFWARRGAVTTRTLRLTGAAVAAYLAALLVLDDPRPVLAPLTALLVVQVTLVGTVADSLRRILSVIAGVAVAVGFSAFVGFSWWSLALIIAVSLLVGQFLRLGGAGQWCNQGHPLGRLFVATLPTIAPTAPRNTSGATRPAVTRGVRRRPLTASQRDTLRPETAQDTVIDVRRNHPALD
jgi:hypothetical protein